MAPVLHVVRAGHGPRIVLVHGSAADHATWSLLLASPMRDRFELVAYDRPADRATVAEHAADLADLIDGTALPFASAAGRGQAATVDQRAIIAGSSFGAVVALELARARPELCRGIVLIEPPMAPSDDPEANADAVQLLEAFERKLVDEGGPAAGELFLRAVLGDVTFERMPKPFQDRAKAKWSQIGSDSAALVAYMPRYRDLASVTVPTLLLGGERSAPYYRVTLEALVVVLPRARLEIIANAGHMLHVEASRRFAELLAGFAETLQP